MTENTKSRSVGRFIGSSAQFTSALQSQLKIALGRGSTDSILTNILSLLKTPADSRFDLSSIVAFMSTVGQRTAREA